MSQIVHRRFVLMAGVLVAAAPILARRAAAQGLRATPRQSEGPFYPVEIPLDADNDLVRVASQPREARGAIAHVAGRVLDTSGRSVAGARVEIWQCDAGGRYLHPNDRGPRDAAFQGFGATETEADGAYRFRTLRPVPYSGRTPHIHFAVVAPGFPRLVTQMYLAGEEQNGRDFLYRRLSGEDQAAVTVALAPAEAGGALTGRFDIVLSRG